MPTPLHKRIVFKTVTKQLRDTFKDLAGRKVKLTYDKLQWSGRTGLVKSYSLKGKTIELLSDEEATLIQNIIAARWKPKK